jgi:succinate dehydrogenase/fumarate reductase cytochrome b subunit
LRINPIVFIQPKNCSTNLRLVWLIRYLACRVVRPTAPAQPFRFHPLDFSVALGVAAAVFMLLAMLVAIAGNNAEIEFFQNFSPGFTPSQKLSIIMGLVWSFVCGFVAGFCIGLLYNWRVSRYFGDANKYLIETKRVGTA